jgi:predicted N-acetyltransferase YhbS
VLVGEEEAVVRESRHHAVVDHLRQRHVDAEELRVVAVAVGKVVVMEWLDQGLEI